MVNSGEGKDNTQLLMYFLPQEEKEQLLDTVKLLTKRSFLGRYIHRGLRHLKAVPFKEIEAYINGKQMNRGVSGAEIVAVMKAICSVMSIVCPLVGTKVPKPE